MAKHAHPRVDSEGNRRPANHLQSTRERGSFAYLALLCSSEIRCRQASCNLHRSPSEGAMDPSFRFGGIATALSLASGTVAISRSPATSASRAASTGCCSASTRGGSNENLTFGSERGRKDAHPPGRSVRALLFNRPPLLEAEAYGALGILVADARGLAADRCGRRAERRVDAVDVERDRSRVARFSGIGCGRFRLRPSTGRDIRSASSTETRMSWERRPYFASALASASAQLCPGARQEQLAS